jgi:hypothetical protein
MDLNKIIQEEMINVLNEAYSMEHENFRFRQRVRDSWFNNYKGFSTDYDTDITESDIIINWHIIFWLNDFGVENFVVSIDGVEGIYRVQLLNKQTDEIEQEVDKDISEIKWKFEVDDAVLQLNGSLYVTGLNFDFKTNICKVQF